MSQGNGVDIFSVLGVVVHLFVMATCSRSPCGLREQLCVHEEEEKIEQPLLDDVPPHIWRQLAFGNKFFKEQAWTQLLGWLHEQLENDPRAITAVTPDKSACGRQNLLCTIAGFRPDVGSDTTDHKECALIILLEHYRQGLINLRCGKSRAPALLQALAQGNIEMGTLLLQWGGGFPPWFLPAVLYGSSASRQCMHCEDVVAVCRVGD